MDTLKVRFCLLFLFRNEANLLCAQRHSDALLVDGKFDFDVPLFFADSPLIKFLFERPKLPLSLLAFSENVHSTQACGIDTEATTKTTLARDVRHRT